MASGIFFLPRTEKRPALSSTGKAGKKAVNNLASGALAVLTASCANDRQTNTYCNPLDIDYSYMVYNSDQNLS